jgi:hypothetical protein
MKTYDIRSMLAGATLALLAACGGASDPATEPASLAAPMAPLNAPVADCEAEGCNRPRIVDGLAEQFRASAIAAPPAEPTLAAAPALAAEPAQVAAPAPSEAGSGAGVTPR